MYPGAQAQNGIPVSNTTWHTVLVTLQTSRSQGSISEKNETGTRDMYDKYYYFYTYTGQVKTINPPIAYFSYMHESITPLLDDVVEF